jgi:hypothetical protein
MTVLLTATLNTQCRGLDARTTKTQDKGGSELRGAAPERDVVVAPSPRPRQAARTHQSSLQSKLLLSVSETVLYVRYSPEYPLLHRQLWS